MFWSSNFILLINSTKNREPWFSLDRSLGMVVRKTFDRSNITVDPLELKLLERQSGQT